MTHPKILYSFQKLEEAFLAGYWLHLDSDNNDLATRKAKFRDWVGMPSPLEVKPEPESLDDVEEFVLSELCDHDESVRYFREDAVIEMIKRFIQRKP